MKLTNTKDKFFGGTKMYTPEVEKKVENSLLATHITENPEFNNACFAGNGQLIMSIVDNEMEKNDLHTKGAEKLRADIIRMLQGRTKVPMTVGTNIMRFVYNSRLSGIGLGVQN